MTDWLAHSQRSGNLRRRSSAAVYGAIWSSLAEWALSQDPPVQPLALTTDHLSQYLGTRRGSTGNEGELSDRHAWTVLNLVHRVLCHRSDTTRSGRNDAASRLIAERPGIRYANANRDALPDHLSPDEGRALVVFLSDARKRRAADNMETFRWQEVRNRAAVALQLGAGLTPGDVRSMRLEGVFSRDRGLPWKLRVPADGNTAERETPLARWAALVLQAWLNVRLAAAIPDRWLFPSTRSGKPWSKMAQYRAAREVLSAAGITGDDGGSFKLRHTFALRQLKRGETPADVARWMGIVQLETLERYSRILLDPVDLD